jgi:hypothetical protein
VPCASSKAYSTLIEDKASGTQLIQELIHDGCHAITRYKPKGDKIMRLYAQTATIENGFVHLPETAPWFAEYLHEMTVLPQGQALHGQPMAATCRFDPLARGHLNGRNRDLSCEILRQLQNQPLLGVEAGAARQLCRLFQCL